VPVRSYRQHCPLAHALDLLGERWTLLVLRELLHGPRRYSELLEGLPSIGTNLLAARLRLLVSESLIERVELTPGIDAYSLTANGRALEDALVALARFGARRMGTRRGGSSIQLSSILLALKAARAPDASQDLDEEYQFEIDGAPLHARIRGGVLHVDSGAAAFPVLVLRTDKETFVSLMSGELSPSAAAASPAVDLAGAPATLERCARVLGWSSGAS